MVFGAEDEALVQRPCREKRSEEAGEGRAKGGWDHGANEVLRALADGRPVRVGEIIEAALSVAALLNLLKCFGVVRTAVSVLRALIGGEPAQEYEQNHAAGPHVSALVVRLQGIGGYTLRGTRSCCSRLARHDFGRHVVDGAQAAGEVALFVADDLKGER